MKTLIIITTFFTFTLTGCQETKTKNEARGFNIEGKSTTCEPMVEDKVCTEIFTAEDRFASKCRELDHTVIQCDCHKFLCDTKDGKPLPFE